jgi:hypothetical protein
MYIYIWLGPTWKFYISKYFITKKFLYSYKKYGVPNMYALVLFSHI